MASLSDVKSRRWWWDSHISPKNSKWLQENLADMDSKVQQMIKLIEEDADSFARRAEMYYKKRPELMKMVEEFYRAYRALAERYENATGAIRQAQRTMVEAFPNHEPYGPGDDSPVSSSPREGGPHTPEMPHPIRAIFDPEELSKDDFGLSSSSFRDAPKNGSAERRSRKGFNFTKFEEKEQQTVHNSESPNVKSRVLSQSERGVKYERELVTMKEALSKLEAEKEADLLQHKHSLDKLSSLEAEVSRAQEDSSRLNERATKAEAGALTLKDELTKLEAEREASNLQYQKCMHTISGLEKTVTLAQENAVELSERASKAELDAQTLKEKVAKLEAERELGHHRYEDSLNTISKLEKSIALAHENITELGERACRADADALTLKEVLTEVKAERDTSLRQYQECLGTISNLEKNIIISQRRVAELTERASKAETESRALKEDLAKLKAEREASLNKISTLEKSIATSQQNVVELSGRASKAETESLTLKEELAEVKMDREASLRQYHECLNTISTLEKGIAMSQQNVIELSERGSKAETESLTLKDDMTKIKVEKEASLRQYRECLNTISTLEKGIAMSQQNVVEFSQRASKAETESQRLNEDLTKVKAERDVGLHQYQECLNTISTLEKSIAMSQQNVSELSDRASKAETECQRLNEDLTKVNAEREASLRQNQECLNTISTLEKGLAVSQQNVLEFSERASKAETESQRLNEDLTKVKAERDVGLHQYQECLNKISTLEKSIAMSQQNVSELSDRASKAETECQRLNEDLTKVNAEREASLRQNQECLNTISTLEKSIAVSQQNIIELSDRATRAENESLTLKDELIVVKTEREASERQYQECLTTISILEAKNIISQENIVDLSGRASHAETEAQALKEDLTKVNAEREASLHRYQECLNTVSNLEMKIALSRENVAELTGRASKAEAESQAVKNALSMAETEKETILVQNNLLLAKFSATEQKLLQAEEDTKKIIAHADKAESDVEKLRESLNILNNEKEEAALRYQERLDTISTLEGKLRSAEEEAETLKYEISAGVLKLKDAEERSLHLEASNQSLESELNSLVQCMGVQNQELTEKQEEIGILRTCIEEERLQCSEIESALHSLQYMQSQSQEELTSLTAELEHRIQGLKDLEAHNSCLVDEVHIVKEENKSLKDLNVSSEHENYCLKQEISELDKKHRDVVQQVESVGLNPEDFGRAVKEIQDDYSKLSDVYQKERNEKVALAEKSAVMGKLFEKNAVLESSISDLSVELEVMKNKVTELEETCHLHAEDKSVLSSEKNIILLQLHNTTENSTFLENKLSEATAELEGLREKVKSLEDSCELLGTEISVLTTEREGLASELQIARQTLEDSAKRQTELEEKYRAVENEKVSALIKVEELQASLDAVRREHDKHTRLSATRTADLELRLCFSQEESRHRMTELEKEQEETFNAQTEVFVLQKCLKDVEGEIISLLIQSQNLFKASELSKKLVSELARENLEREGKVKSLTCQISNTKTRMRRVLQALDIDSDNVCEDEIVDQDVAFMERILIEIEDRNESNSKFLDEHQQLILENMILCTLLEQLGLDASNLHTEKNKCIHELKMRSKEITALQDQRQYLEEENCAIRSEAVSSSVLSVIFQHTIIEKSLLLNELGQNLDESHDANRSMDEKVKTLEVKLRMAGTENDQLKESLEKTQNELKRVLFVCSQLENQVSGGSELLHIKESELAEAEKKLQALLIEKTELQNLMEGLTRNFDEVNSIKGEQEQHIFKLSGEIDAQSKEWQRLGDMTERLDARLLTLQEGHKETEVKEESLTTQLAKWKTEAEIRETEGMAFFTDLQISSIQEMFFLQKITELTEAYNHQVNYDFKEIDCLKQSIGTLEENNGGLKFQLNSWTSGISSLERSIVSLEKFMLRHLDGNKADKEEFVKDDKLESCLQSVTGDKQNGNDDAKVMPDNLLDLQVLETRIRAIENAMIEREKHAVDERLSSRRGTDNDPDLLKPAQEISEAEGETLPKDIMLDQISKNSSYGLSKSESVNGESHMLKLWEATDHNGSIIQEHKRRRPSSEILDKLDISKRFVDPLQEGKKKNILERLDSDLQKLENLQVTVQDLIRKIETSEKIKTRKGLEYDTVKDQLQQSEEAILELFDVNKKLTDTVKEDVLSSEEKSVADSEHSGTVRNIVTEQARRGSEKIGRLQLEVQKLQFLLLKFDDEKESKGKTQRPERRKRIILHNYIRDGILRSGSKQGSFCACLRPSTKDE